VARIASSNVVEDVTGRLVSAAEDGAQHAMSALDEATFVATGEREVLSALPLGRGPTPSRVAHRASHEPTLATRCSFREVYDDHFGFVWRSAANRGVPRAALDDVVQEVFIVIHRKLPEFEGRSSLRTWIAAIVRRVIADYVKKRGNQPAGDERLEREPASELALSEQVERKAAAQLLDALLAKMTEEQREVFLLHEIEQMSGTEIADLTGANENTVWTRLRAARRIFQEGVARQRTRHNREQS
jgi:RNA polymerase sigma-70 factor (ECF subfamily)